MKTIIKSYLSYILLCTFLFSNYQTLLLVEFDNLDKNRSTDYLRHQIPDFVKNNNYIQNNFNIEYAGKIEPYLNFKDHNYNNALLLIGDYKTESNNFNIKLNLIDMSNWNTAYSVDIICNQFDNGCIEKSINDLFPTIFNSDVIENDPINDSSNKLEVFENIYNSIDDFVAEADFHYSWEQLNKYGNQYGDRYYKKIDEDRKNELILNNKESNTIKLLSFFDQILMNPYNVNIGEMEIDFFESDEKSVIINFPVSYTIKHSLIEDLLTIIPHKIETNSNGTVVIKFSDEHYFFTDEINEHYSLGEYQVAPVIFITDSIGKLQDVFIDTWDNDVSNNFLDIKSRNSYFYNDINFYPLFSIMPGQKNMQINMDTNTQNILYSIKIDADYFNKYSKVAIKFIPENHIENFFHFNY